MKKFIVVVLAVLALATSANAQSKAIGLRLGYGAEVSYQHYVGNNFIEADLGLVGFGANLYVTGIYNFNIGQLGPVDFYAGPGASVGFYSRAVWDEAADTYRNGLGIGLGIAGQIGAEYQFASIPLALSLDWRPAYYILGGWFSWSGFALGVRYTF